MPLGVISKTQSESKRPLRLGLVADPSLSFVKISTWALLGLGDPLAGRKTKPGKVGWGLLLVAGLGEAMASVFEVKYEVGHGIAGLLGVLGLPDCGAAGQRERRPHRGGVCGFLWLALFT